jgi:chitin disaccharide deacetylase
VARAASYGWALRGLAFRPRELRLRLTWYGTRVVGNQTSTRDLIVNADDYGYTAGVSEGIRLAHRQGIVSSTSVMMTMPSAMTELMRLRGETPTLGVGVHLTVTEGRLYRLPRCLAPRELASELACVSAADLRAEWGAQIDAFLEAGIPLTHLDSHHHAAYRHATALAISIELAHDHGVPIRNPYPLGAPNADALADALAHSDVRHPDHFVDVFDRTRSVTTLVRALDAVPVGVTEFMFHPGLVDDELRRRCPSRSQERAAELEALTDPEARAALDRLGIKLVSFAALAVPP